MRSVFELLLHDICSSSVSFTAPLPPCATLRIMNKNNRKEALFNAAFKLFLLYQYKGVSLKMIEEEAHMTRGAIFYYAKNKEDLYRQVVKHYWIDRQNLRKKMKIDHPTLKDFIMSYTEAVGNTMSSLAQLLSGCSIQQASQAYLSFLMQLKKTAPDLHDEYLTNRNNELVIWHGVIQEATRTGEIRADIDCFAMAEQFVYTFYGLTFWEALDCGLNVDHLRRQYLSLYKSLQ